MLGRIFSPFCGSAAAPMQAQSMMASPPKDAATFRMSMLLDAYVLRRRDFSGNVFDPVTKCYGVADLCGQFEKPDDLRNCAPRSDHKDAGRGMPGLKMCCEMARQG